MGTLDLRNADPGSVQSIWTRIVLAAALFLRAREGEISLFMTDVPWNGQSLYLRRVSSHSCVARPTWMSVQKSLSPERGEAGGLPVYLLLLRAIRHSERQGKSPFRVVLGVEGGAVSQLRAPAVIRSAEQHRASPLSRERSQELRRMMEPSQVLLHPRLTHVSFPSTHPHARLAECEVLGDVMCSLTMAD
jgi:hypothetical protein